MKPSESQPETIFSAPRKGAPAGQVGFVILCLATLLHAVQSGGLAERIPYGCEAGCFLLVAFMAGRRIRVLDSGVLVVPQGVRGKAQIFLPDASVEILRNPKGRRSLAITPSGEPSRTHVVQVGNSRFEALVKEVRHCTVESVTEEGF